MESGKNKSILEWIHLDSSRNKLNHLTLDRKTSICGYVRMEQADLVVQGRNPKCATCFFCALKMPELLRRKNGT